MTKLPPDDEQAFRNTFAEVPMEQVITDIDRESAKRWHELCDRLGWDGYTVDHIIAMIDQAKSEEGH